MGHIETREIVEEARRHEAQGEERVSGGLAMQQLAVEVWRHSHSIEFGQCESWDADLFLSPWAKSLARANASGPYRAWSKYREGWYWFLVEGPVAEHARLERPATLPAKGRDIGVVAKENLRLFGKELLCAESIGGRTVVYNGHEKSVKSRARAHFCLGNNGTGALGIKHFPMQTARWELRLFGEPCLAELSVAIRDTVSTLMATKTGRSAIESAWRAVYGWPLLCKQ